MKLTDATILSIDTETTGFDHDTDRICEVGWSRIRNEQGQFYCGVGCGRLFNPKIPIPAVASAVHHITDDDVKEGPCIEEWGKELKADLIIAHNAPFDRGFMLKESAIEEDIPWLCTFRLARHLIPEAPAYGNQVLRYHLGFYDVPGDAHRAGHDACVTAMIFCHMLNHRLEAEMEDVTVEGLIEFSEEPVFLIGKIGFGKHRDETWTEAPRSYLQWMATQGKDAWDVDVWFTINEILAGRRGTT